MDTKKNLHLECNFGCIIDQIFVKLEIVDKFDMVVASQIVYEQLQYNPITFLNYYGQFDGNLSSQHCTFSSWLNTTA